LKANRLKMSKLNIEKLYAQIGQLKVENDPPAGGLQETGDMNRRVQLVTPGTPKLSVRKQCDLLLVNRNRFYYRNKPESEMNIRIKHIMDKHLMLHPTEGEESMFHYLGDFGYRANPKRIRRLLKLMGREIIYRRKNLTKMGLREYIKPYLVRRLDITHTNQVWCTDITYIPMKKEFMSMTAIMDVYSRKTLSWSLSNSMLCLPAGRCLNVLKEAIDRYGKPEVVNSDRSAAKGLPTPLKGSQYTSALWTQYLEKEEIKISMDGKGRATDNAWIERFWKSIKYDYILLNLCDDGFEIFDGVQTHIEYYNPKTHHTTKQKPIHIYMESLARKAA
jgi:putative transposase